MTGYSENAVDIIITLGLAALFAHTSFNYTNVQDKSSSSSATFITTAPTAPNALTTTTTPATTAVEPHSTPAPETGGSSTYPPPHLSAEIPFSQGPNFTIVSKYPPKTLTSQQ